MGKTAAALATEARLTFGTYARREGGEWTLEAVALAVLVEDGRRREGNKVVVSDGLLAMEDRRRLMVSPIMPVVPLEVDGRRPIPRILDENTPARLDSVMAVTDC